MKTYKRRRVLIDKRLQYKLLIININYFIVLLLVVGLALFGPLLLEFYGAGINYIEKSVIAENILYLHVRLWPPFIAAAALFAIHSIFVSHRIAGPLYRFRAVLKRLREGDFSEDVRIRKHDYLHQDEEVMNEMIHTLRKRITKIKAEQQAVSDVLANVDLNSENISPEFKSQLSRMENHVAEMRRQLDAFRVGDETIPPDCRGHA